MFLSIVIPAYNEEKYLPRCLESLRAQNYPAKDFEIVVVDNASTDATANIARRFGARVVYEPVKGIARARQRGFEAARGEIIANTDADTVVPNNWLSRIARHFGRDPHLGGVYGPVYWFDGQLHEELIMRYPVTWALSVSNRLKRSWWIGSNWAVRAEVFWRVQGFEDFAADGLIADDWYISTRVSRVARVLFDPDLAVYSSARRAREGSNFLRRMALSAMRVMVLGQPALPTPDIR